MAKNLDELKSELYGAFNKALGNADYPYNAGSYPEQAKAAAESLRAAAATAEAIVKVEHEIAERDAAKAGMKLPGKP